MNELGRGRVLAAVLFACACSGATPGPGATTAGVRATPSTAASSSGGGGATSSSSSGGSTGGAACTCDALTTGLCAPLPVCTTEDPCDDGNGRPALTSPQTNPACKTSPDAGAARAAYADPLLSWTDPDTGDERAACVYAPSGSAKVPLLVFFHGSLSSADMVYNETSLRTKALSFALGDTSGFALASMQGRNLHWPDTHNEGAHHDFFYRDLGTQSGNPDVRAADHLVDALVAQGGVDPARIFAVGWSNGAFFAEEYAIARHASPTPGGNLVAAAAVYAGADPFDNLSGGQTPTCQLESYPETSVPLLVVHRDCDAQVGCDEAQRHAFGLPPGFAVEDWLTGDLWGSMGDAAATGAVTFNAANRTWLSGGDLLLSGGGAQLSSCAAPASCAASQGNANHHAWPDGIADGSGVDWEPALLTFLQKHHR